MTTQEVSERYYELIQQHKYEQIQDELYSEDAVNIEPENDTDLPLVVQGPPALREKEGLFFSHVETMFGAYMSEPVVSTFFFSMMTGMDVKMKGKDRKNKSVSSRFGREKSSKSSFSTTTLSDDRLE